MRMKGKRRSPPKEHEVREAVRRFLKDGGLIKTLPPEPDPPPYLLVGRHYGVYEQINNDPGREP